MNIRLLGLLFLCYMHQTYANVLSKAYLHKAPFTQELTSPVQLELAKLVFYFAEQPAMQMLQEKDSKKNGWLREVYMITNATVDAACRASLQEIAQNNDHYQIVCTEITTPEKAIKIELSYNPQVIACYRDTFDAITNHKGIVFRLVNNQLLKQLDAQKEMPLIQLACAQRPMVVIDCGHGAADTGAISSAGLAEKEVTLQVGKQLDQLLKQHNIRTQLTRTEDVFVPLDMRTRCINDSRADFYVSIHANSAANSSVKGLETFCLAPKLFTAQGEQDATFKAHLHKLYAQSYKLTDQIHNHLLAYMQKEGEFLSDRKIRHNVAQLLLGTNTPGVLIEIGYLSHAQEATLLAMPAYQQKIAQGICSGILAYISA